MIERLRRALEKQVDASGVAVFRMAFGVLVVVSVIRFFAYGWIDELYTKPKFFFTFWGMSHVTPLGGRGMHTVFAAIGLLALMVAIGAFYRIAIVLLFALFTYVQLVDVTNYLNHYYLVSLLAFLLCFTPANAKWSVDAWISPERARQQLPAFYTYLLRFQITVVYFYAGLAKANVDWLLHAQPLNIWLNARTNTPIIGSLFALPHAAYVMSWGGFLFDTTIPFFMLQRWSRPYAYAVIVIFHVFTQVLFPIGMFPSIMATSALIFFEPDWPRRLLAYVGIKVDEAKAASQAAPINRIALSLVLLYCAIQIGFPLRHRIYGGDVSWHEQGMRFSWKVMTREKNGSVTYNVTDPETGRTWEVLPRKYLTDRQLRDFSTQPDMILQLGHHVGEEHSRRLGRKVRVTVDALVSLNGRPAALLIDPNVNLLDIRDGMGLARWILPSPRNAPPHFVPVS